MAVASDRPGEEYFPVLLGQGMYTSELSSNIPDGYSAICYNMVASGDSLENRIGIKRSTIDWKVYETNPGAGTTDADDYSFFVEIDPWGKNSAQPAFMWGATGFAVPAGTPNVDSLSLVRAAGTADANDGFMSVVIPDKVLGIAQYRDSIYFSVKADGIKKISSINWATDAVIYTAIASSAGGTLKGLFTFKDRMWAYNGHYLYFTDIPSVGNFPETWALAANRIPFVGPTGAGNIKKIIPLGNRLAVFTTAGLFTLLVEGAPGSWIQRILDSKSIITSSQCAFESKGVIYYVNTEGVWATNTQEVTKLSGVIEDQWFLAKGARVHSICHYEDGMIVSVAKAATVQGFFDVPNCRIFYSKLDPIGWTEWNINRNGMGTRPEQMALFWSATAKIPTYLNAEPTVYAMVHITASTDAVNALNVMQVLIMDGGVDQYVDPSNTQRELPVGIYLKTKSIDGGNQFRIKTCKRAMLELYTSDAEHDFTGSWDIDMTTDEATEVEGRQVNDFTVGVGSNLIQVRSRFRYRRCAFNFRASLQAAESQIKIKDLALVQDTVRSVGEQVS
jgi:hypothetical protein